MPRRRQRDFCVLFLSVLTLWSHPHESDAFQQPSRPLRIRLHQDETTTSASPDNTISSTRLYQASVVQEGQKPKRKGSSNISTSRELEQKIVQLGRKGKTTQAITIYKEAPNKTLRMMNAAIDACARARPTRLEQAFQILQESDLEPNVFTFGALMSACARARRGDKARALLKSMQGKYGVAPNEVVYSSAISAVARSNPPQPQVAVALLKEATEKHNLVMNVVCYNAAISACANAGDWQRATALLRELESDDTTTRPDAVTYGTVLSACENGEQWDLVLDYAQAAMEDLGGDCEKKTIGCASFYVCSESMSTIGVGQGSLVLHPQCDSDSTTESQNHGLETTGCQSSHGSSP